MLYGFKRPAIINLYFRSEKTGNIGKVTGMLRVGVGAEGKGPYVLNLGTVRKREISFILRPLYVPHPDRTVYWIRGWAGPTAGLDAVPLPGIEPRSSNL